MCITVFVVVVGMEEDGCPCECWFGGHVNLHAEVGISHEMFARTLRQRSLPYGVYRINDFERAFRGAVRALAHPRRRTRTQATHKWKMENGNDHPIRAQARCLF
jgi:hypothetical protein